jgi:predicted nucleic acid-binding Zn ribbon protein
MTWKKWSPVDDAVYDVRPMGDSVAKIARQLGLSTPTRIIQVFSNWEEVVGSVIAAHSRPERLRAGELLVMVDEPAWATELRFLEAEVLAKLNAVQAGDPVTSMVVRVDRQKKF